MPISNNAKHFEAFYFLIDNKCLFFFFTLPLFNQSTQAESLKWGANHRSFLS